MSPEDFSTVVNPFSEYAMLFESEDYPKTDVSTILMKGRVDEDAFARAYDEAMALVPLFNCRLVERREGIFRVPYWEMDPEVKNRLVIDDARHLASEPFDVEDFAERYFEPRISRCIDLRREFSWNVSLVRCTGDLWMLAVVFHHSVVDPVKAFTVLTETFAKYHEKITGEYPAWTKAPAIPAAARKNALVTPVPFHRFALEQLSDVWFRNRKSRMDRLAGGAGRMGRNAPGRNTCRLVIDDMDLLQQVVDRAIGLGGTFNDMLLAIWRKVFTDWNHEHGAGADRFRFMVVTSLHGRMELPKNVGAALAGLNFVSAGHREADLETLVTYFAQQRTAQLGRGVDIHFFKLLTRLVRALRVFSLETRKKLLRPVVESIPCTLALSNIGVLWTKEIFPDGRQSLESRITRFGELEIVDLYSTISVTRNVDLLMAARTYHRKMYINLVSDRCRMSKEETKELRERFRAAFENAV